MCPIAWRIILEGLVPIECSTPPIVAECGKRLHDKLLEVVKGFFNPLRNTDSLALFSKPKMEYNVEFRDEYRLLILKPDLYLIMEIARKPVNVVVEVTTRTSSTVPIEWLVAYSLGSYLLNMQPSFTLLITPEEVKALPLSITLLQRLERLLKTLPKRKPEAWMCSNCDLRYVCPEPLA